MAWTELRRGVDGIHHGEVWTTKGGHKNLNTKINISQDLREAIGLSDGDTIRVFLNDDSTEMLIAKDDTGKSKIIVRKHYNAKTNGALFFYYRTAAIISGISDGVPRKAKATSEGIVVDLNKGGKDDVLRK